MKLLLFDNVHRVMQAEETLKGAGSPCELLPTPKEYSTECGMCLAVKEGQLERVEALLDDIEHSVVDFSGAGR